MPANPFTDGRSRNTGKDDLVGNRNHYKGGTQAANVSGNRDTQNKTKEE